MELENAILSEGVRQRQTLYEITYMYSLKNNTNISTHKTEIDSQTQKTNLRLPQMTEKDKLKVWDQQI